MERGTAKRLLRGTGVTWIRLGVTICAQFVTVPIFLAYWKVETYGIWLAIGAAVSVFQLPGLSHQDFIGYELLKHRTKRPHTFTKVFRSAVRVGIVYGIFELLIAALIAFCFVLLPIGYGLSAKEKWQIGLTFLLMASGSGLVWNWGGIWVRAAVANGYYERCAWWGVADGIVKAAAPLVAVPFGAGMAAAAATLSLCLTLLYIVTLADLNLSAKSSLRPGSSSKWRYGCRNFLCAQVLSLKSLMELARQQGTRLLLTPLTGAAEMAAFATTRTGANAALQGLNTVTNPLMPELMRFLNQKDQPRSEAAFGTVWLVLVGVMAPAAVAAQLVAPPVFAWWTHGKMLFDPLLFSTLSLAVLIYALAQPAIAVVQGNNLLRTQLFLSTLAGALAVGGMLLLVPLIGVRGAGFALLMAEILAAAGYVHRAALWLRGNGLRWPSGAFSSVLIAVTFAGVGMFAIWIYPKLGVEIAGVYLLGQTLSLLAYWRQVPELARRHSAEIIVPWLPARLRNCASRVLIGQNPQPVINKAL